MKTRVNFYFEEFRPKTYLINIGFTALLWSIAALIVIAAAISANGKNEAVKRELMIAENAIDDKRKVLTMLAGARDDQNQDPALLADIERFQQEFNLKKRIVNELSGRETQKSSGYSELMLDLARVHQQGIWLTQIRLDGANIRIEGGASNSSAVPQWVNKLSDASFFSGAEFAQARMFRDEEQQLHFVLNSRIEGPTENNGERVEQ